MQANTLRTREVIFAYLFGPPRFVQRDEASRVYDRLCEKLGYDDIAFQYDRTGSTTSRSSPDFTIRLNRKEGQGGLSIEISSTVKPMRLLMQQLWPASVEHVREAFDMGSEAIFDALPGEWQKVLAEVRWRAQCNTRSGGLSFLQKSAIGFSEAQIEQLGSLEFASVKLELAPSQAPDSAIADPKRGLTIEPLREDPQSLYLELTSTWAQFPLVSTRPSQPIEVDLSRAREIVDKPSEYVRETERFLIQNVMGLGAEE